MRFAITTALFLILTASAFADDRIPTAEGDVTIHPIEHATFVMTWNTTSIYVDPVGGAQRFQSLPRPNLILITDIHRDHMDAATLQGLIDDDTVVVAPPAVVEKLPRRLRKRVIPVSNGLAVLSSGLEVQAIPMYNLTPERLQFHTKGRGNGYIVIMGGKRFYISGDTEDIPEMRALKNIDVAFVCMNLPYTMTVEQAADAVREFKPAIVYPYHYRGISGGTPGLSDVRKFKSLVSEAPGIEVRQLKWYPGE